MSESGEDNQDEFKPVHLLSSNHVGEETETELTDNCTARGCNFDGCVRGFWNGAWCIFVVLPVDGTQHVCYHANGEDVVGILVQLDTYFDAAASTHVTYSEETNTSNDNGANVIPPIPAMDISQLVSHIHDNACFVVWVVPRAHIPEWRFVYLGKSKSSPFVWIRNVSIVVVEVVEGSVAPGRSGSHCKSTSLPF